MFDEDGILTGIVAVGRDFTAEKKAEAEIKWAQDALRKSEEQYRLVVESQSEMINQFRPDGEIIFLNNNYRNFVERVWGYHKVTTGINLFGVVDENTGTWIKREIGILKTEEDRWEHEECIRDLDGIEIFVRWENKALFDEEGRVTSFLSVGRDVTLERKAEEKIREVQEALRKREQQHRVIMDGIPDMIDQVTPEGEIIYSNRSRREFLRDAGVEESGGVGANIFDHMASEDAIELRENFENFDPEHPISQHEMIFIGANGQKYHLRWRNQALFDDDGKVSSVVGIGRDFTSEKRAEGEIRRVQEALSQREAQYRLVVESQSEIINQFEPSGEIIFCNKNYEDYFERSWTSEKGRIGSNLFENVDKDTADLIKRELSKLKTEDDRWVYEERNKESDDREILVHWENKALFDADGKVWSYLSVGRDITEAKLAEQKILRTQEALRQSEERNRLILDRAFAAVVSMDLEGRITAWNFRAEETFGWSKDEAIGRLVGETIIPVRYRERHRKGLEL